MGLPAWTQLVKVKVPTFLDLHPFQKICHIPHPNLYHPLHTFALPPIADRGVSHYCQLKVAKDYVTKIIPTIWDYDMKLFRAQGLVVSISR